MINLQQNPEAFSRSPPGYTRPVVVQLCLELADVTVVKILAQSVQWFRFCRRSPFPIGKRRCSYNRARRLWLIVFVWHFPWCVTATAAATVATTVTSVYLAQETFAATGCEPTITVYLLHDPVLWSREHGLETRVHSSSFFPGLGIETWWPRSRSWSRDLKKVLTTVLARSKKTAVLGSGILHLFRIFTE